MKFVLLLAALPLTAQTLPSTTFILTGDAIINRRVSVYQESNWKAMIGRIRSADAAFTNLETNITDFSLPGGAQSGGIYQGSPAWVLDELKWMGFQLISAANNHAYDFGERGVLMNMKALDAAGVTYAGIGKNLARARAPAYLDTSKGRIALIATASTLPVAAAAGEQRIDMPGRPGANPLRFETVYNVNAATLQVLHHLSGVAGTGALSFRGARFQLGQTASVETMPNSSDLNQLLASIRDARRQADWVIVSLHAHESLPGDRRQPAAFIPVFAHAAIDAGADIVAIHGPHVLRPIEIYHGKPIFYSLANFIFQNDTVLFQPAEPYLEGHLPADTLPGAYYDDRTHNDTRGFPADEENFESVIAQVAFDGGKLAGITLFPIELGFGKPRTSRGPSAACLRRQGSRYYRATQSYLGALWNSCHLQGWSGASRAPPMTAQNGQRLDLNVQPTAIANWALDADPVETQEWIASFDSVLRSHGPERCRFLLEALVRHLRLAAWGPWRR